MSASRRRGFCIAVSLLVMTSCSSKNAEVPDGHSQPPQTGSPGRSTAIPPGIAQHTLPWAGSVDMLNGSSIPRTSPENPVSISLGQKLELQGWGATGTKPPEPFDAIYVVLADQQFKASVSDRPDVGAYFKTPQLSKAGFKVVVDTSTLRKGLYSLAVIGVTSTNVTYRYPAEIYVRIE